MQRHRKPLAIDVLHAVQPNRICPSSAALETVSQKQGARERKPTGYVPDLALPQNAPPLDRGRRRAPAPQQRLIREAEDSLAQRAAQHPHEAMPRVVVDAALGAGAPHEQELFGPHAVVTIGSKDCSGR